MSEMITDNEMIRRAVTAYAKDLRVKAASRKYAGPRFAEVRESLRESAKRYERLALRYA